MQITKDIFLEIIPLCNDIITSKPTYNNNYTQAPPLNHWKRDRGSPGYENNKLVMLKRSKSYT